APGSVPVLPPPPAQSVTVALAPPRSVPVAVEPAKPGVRLERLSMGEVALVTSERPRWQSSTVARTATSITIRFDKQPSSRVTLLNAARVQGLAARTRTFLTKRGFGPAVIGDAPAIRQKSLISFAAADRPLAERLAAQFGFALERRQDKGALTILLGRDAAGDGAIGRPRG
ncbi:MAG TPA: LytR C-terminal domain-containing protein, partial [Sphingomicrobium sp.]|nr:LytR C-terminal domain-containing protein [Sphingomicrobium sp.]